MVNVLAYRAAPEDLDPADEAARQRRERQLDDASLLLADARNQIRQIGKLLIPGEIQDGALDEHDYPVSVATTHPRRSEPSADRNAT